MYKNVQLINTINIKTSKILILTNKMFMDEGWCEEKQKQ